MQYQKNNEIVKDTRVKFLMWALIQQVCRKIRIGRLSHKTQKSQ